MKFNLMAYATCDLCKGAAQGAAQDAATSGGTASAWVCVSSCPCAFTHLPTAALALTSYPRRSGNSSWDSLKWYTASGPSSCSPNFRVKASSSRLSSFAGSHAAVLAVEGSLTPNACLISCLSNSFFCPTMSSSVQLHANSADYFLQYMLHPGCAFPMGEWPLNAESMQKAHAFFDTSQASVERNDLWNKARSYSWSAVSKDKGSKFRSRFHHCIMGSKVLAKERTLIPECDCGLVFSGRGYWQELGSMRMGYL
eukprot:200673-Pelagomonas_calceolata.AAC.3